MGWEKNDPKGGGQDEQRECSCCLNIENSIVIIVCGEVDPGRICDNIKQIAEIKMSETTIK
ncbi:MAG: hypothetical protein PWP72_1485 [Thermoanaerobacter sp.]|jgi:hypothetical protein|nr:hypothetical protein [Thermoanaerobacter sp.]